MYNLTYLDHRVTLPWLDLRSNFDLDLSRSNYTWFDAPWRGKHDGIKIGALPLKLNILSSKNRFGKFWNFDPWWPQLWPEPKKWPKLLRNDVSRAFERRFPFCSTMRRSRDRRGGGCSNTPSRWWKIQRPSRAGVNHAVIFFQCDAWLPSIISVYVPVSVIKFGNLGEKRHPSSNNIPLFLPGWRIVFYSPMCWLMMHSEFWCTSFNFNLWIADTWIKSKQYEMLVVFHVNYIRFSAYFMI